MNLTQLSLTQIENIAKATGNGLAIELLNRIDDSVESGKAEDIKPYLESYQEGYDKGHDDAHEESYAEGETSATEKLLDSVERYLFSIGFTAENVDTFLSKIKE